MTEIFGKFIGAILMHSLGWYLKKWAIDEQGRKDYVAFVEIMNRRGLLSVEMQDEALRGIDLAWKEWEKENQG